jgi:hypothetical protein
MTNIGINQYLYKKNLGRYQNANNAIKIHSLEISLDIFEELNLSSMLIFTNAVIQQNYLEKFISQSKDFFIVSHSEKILNAHEIKNSILSSNLEHINKKFDFILLDLTLNFANDIIKTLNFYETILNKGGVFIANILGGKTLYELSNIMMEVDLLENRMIPRMLPKLSSEGLLNLSKNSNFKNPIVMNNEFIEKYINLKDLIQSLDEIGHIYPMVQPNHPYTTRKYWEVVEEQYRATYQLQVSFEILTLFAVK